MKIAVPTTSSNQVDSHFGHCEFYSLFTIDSDKKVTSTELLPSPQGCGCKSNIASVLKDKGVTVMLAGNMGGGALNVLTSHDITVFRGCTGEITTVVNDYLMGKINDSGEACKSHAHGQGEHSCDHHK